MVQLEEAVYANTPSMEPEMPSFVIQSPPAAVVWDIIFLLLLFFY